ncbi:MAG: hypothetical protein CML16_11140 [Pusillimonas sp.]|nr:hypothetical protein [Pusillimonas sp.]MBC40669.1 hypothetical protein [Pusillimonas sp.]HCP77736.1 hypothetical protein [Pusillimonas sp.]|tara:strand:- start:23525 stop:24193 length:669 start_codon:yes stop_codon:yes gene_type:complete
MTQDKNQNLSVFYWKLIVDTVEGVQKKICDENGIALSPKSAEELCPIPVFEEAKANLLQTANYARRPTEIKWITNGTFEYLNAYIKSYKDPTTKRKRSEVVVTTPNYCLARFFAAKELMHCFIDDDGHSATNTLDLARSLIDDLAASGLPRTEPQTIVDEFAWLGATRYLIPDGWVGPITKTIEELNKVDSANAYYYVAQKIRAPEVVLRARLRLAGRKVRS